MSSQSRIYVGHLDQRTRESDLEKFFKGYGRIREITMKSGFAFVVSFFLLLLRFLGVCLRNLAISTLSPTDREKVIDDGFFLQEFEDYRDADDAVHELNGKELLGSR